MRPIVSCLQISKSFVEQKVLDSLSFDVMEGELFFLLGPSGCGKTTLLRIIAGIENQDSGQICISNSDMQAVAPEKRGVGMVFQNYALWPHLTVKQHIEFGLKSLKLPKSLSEQRVQDTAALLKISDLMARFPHELSGGQQQRVSLARALAPHPKLVLLDEPLSNLDPELRDEMRLELRRIQKKLNLTFIYVTHDRTEALSIGDRIAIINKGKLEQIGSPADLYFSPANSFVARFMGETNLLSGEFLISANGDAGIVSELGFISAPAHQKFEKSGLRLEFSLRPEDLKIKNEIKTVEDQTRVPAEIVQVIPLGIIAYIKLKLLSGRELTASVAMRRSQEFEAGMKVTVTTSWERIWLFNYLSDAQV